MDSCDPVFQLCGRLRLTEVYIAVESAEREHILALGVLGNRLRNRVLNTYKKLTILNQKNIFLIHWLRGWVGGGGGDCGKDLFCNAYS